MCVEAATAARFCLGTAQLGMDYGVANRGGRPDDADCEAVLARAVQLGVLRFDTARAYGDAERRLGKFFSNCPQRDLLQVVSKLPLPPPEVAAAHLRDWVSAQLDESLRTLNLDRLAGWLIHQAATVERYGSALWDAMWWQVDRGVTEQIGLSVYDERELAAALKQPPGIAVQLTLNLLDHRFVASGQLQQAKARSDTIYARSAVLQGAFALSPESLPNRLQHLRQPLETLATLLDGYGLTALNAALPFVLAHEEIDFVVIGVDNVTQLENNLSRGAQALPDGLKTDLRRVFQELPVAVLEPRRWPTDVSEK